MATTSVAPPITGEMVPELQWRIYETMVLARRLSERLLQLQRAGIVPLAVPCDGHEALRRAGFAPPTDAPSFTADSVVDLNPLGALRPQLIPCPYCDSKSTMLENRFGPTLCRSIYYCNNCRQPFEAFKAV